MNNLNKSQSPNSRAGFTLMELMVYMLIAGIVAILAGQAFSDSTKMRVRTESMVEANQVAGDVSSLLKQDMSLIGAKSSMEAASDDGGNTFMSDKMNLVYMDADKGDSSSYVLTKGKEAKDRLDRIKMRRLRYDDAGHFASVEEVEWYVENKTLKRKCTTTEGTADEACPSSSGSTVNIVGEVEKFEVDEASPKTDGQISHVRLMPSDNDVSSFRLVSRFGDEHFSPVMMEPDGGGEQVKVYGFAANYDFENKKIITDEGKVRVNQVYLAPAIETAGNWQSLCKKVTLEAGVEYEISFNMALMKDPSRMFCPGRDHMAVGFRKQADGERPKGLEDFMFYPPTVGGNDAGARKMRFTPKEKAENVCLAFTFVSYSPLAASGSVMFEKVKLEKVSNSANDFSTTTIATANKKNVKSLRVRFKKLVNGEGANNEFIVPIPSNGPRD